jgi:phosphoglycerate dehydrogenase-like enzyme
LENYEGILSWHTDFFNKEEIEKFKNLKGIVRVWTKKIKKKDWNGKRSLEFNSNQGFDNVDIKTCGEKGIIVSNVPEFEI